MTKELKWASIALVALVVIWGINSLMQNRHVTKTGEVFDVEKDDVWEVTISKDNESITLVRTGDSWTIAGNDSLVMKSGRIDNLFSKTLAVKRETMISSNPTKWATYSVDDSLGSFIQVKDVAQKELASAIFGRSSSDWSHNYVRTSGEDEVYLTNENVVYTLNTSPKYWGEIPKPPKPDTTATNPFE